MEVDEQLKKAWEAVVKSGVPEALQAVALQEAMESLRAGAAEGGEPRPQRKSSGGSEKSGRKVSAKGKSGATTPVPDEDTFFSRLAEEAGVAQNDLRDILQLKNDGAVHVNPPTRKFGSSVAEQARNIIALVAGARAVALDERPVKAAAVRKELERKR
ncbi:MAG: hypothetical protein ACR2M2_05735, partial [Gaiellaceae bacterium]